MAKVSVRANFIFLTLYRVSGSKRYFSVPTTCECRKSKQMTLQQVGFWVSPPNTIRRLPQRILGHHHLSKFWGKKPRSTSFIWAATQLFMRLYFIDANHQVQRILSQNISDFSEHEAVCLLCKIGKPTNVAPFIWFSFYEKLLFVIYVLSAL